MLRVNIYIPEGLNTRLVLAAQARRQIKAELIRELLEKGLQDSQPKSNSAQALLDLSSNATKVPTKGRVPKDFITNLDFYTWGGKKRG